MDQTIEFHGCELTGHGYLPNNSCGFHADWRPISRCMEATRCSNVELVNLRERNFCFYLALLAFLPNP